MAKRTIALLEAQLYYHRLSPAICGGYFQLKKIGLSHLYASRQRVRESIRQRAICTTMC